MKSDIDRFWSKVNKTDTCWLWTGYRRKNGYPPFYIKKPIGKYISSYRYSYELKYGKVEKYMHIDHLCRVPLCVNPDHLEAVTPRENILRGNTTKNKKSDLPTGVTKDKQRYKAGKCFYGKRFYICGFRTPEDASVVYQTMIMDGHYES